MLIVSISIELTSMEIQNSQNIMIFRHANRFPCFLHSYLVHTVITIGYFETYGCQTAHLDLHHSIYLASIEY